MNKTINMLLVCTMLALWPACIQNDTDKDDTSRIFEQNPADQGTCMEQTSCSRENSCHIDENQFGDIHEILVRYNGNQFCPRP